MSATRMASTASEVGVVTARGRVASLPDDRTRPFSAVRRRRFDVCLGGVISHSLFTLTASAAGTALAVVPGTMHKAVTH